MDYHPVVYISHKGKPYATTLLYQNEQSYVLAYDSTLQFIQKNNTYTFRFTTWDEHAVFLPLLVQNIYEAQAYMEVAIPTEHFVEKRKGKRVRGKIRSEISTIFEEGEEVPPPKRVHFEIINISRFGMAIIMAQPLPVGLFMTSFLRIGEQMPNKVMAEVVRCEQVYNLYMIGCAFHCLDFSCEQAIRNYVQEQV